MSVGLIYHDIASAQELDVHGFPGPLAARYKLSPEQFEAHLDAIAATGVTVAPFTAGGQAAITFDDGGSSALHAAAALEARGWRGSFFITTGRIDTPGFLSTDQVRELAQRGHEVGSHSRTHPT
jgi:peptidoglycan/xylan/chitin deacetylase (PgdA/CDA1 family)